MFFCLNVSGQYPFTYTEIKESVYNIDGFIEKLIMDKDFNCVEKYKKLDDTDCTLFFKDYKKDTGMANVWVTIKSFSLPDVIIEENTSIQFSYEQYYNYLVAEIKKDCEKSDFIQTYIHNDNLKKYMNYYKYSDGTIMLISLKKSPGNRGDYNIKVSLSGIDQKLIIAKDVDYIELVKEVSKMSIAEGDPDYYGLIVKQAKEEWKDDYSMIAYEIKKQCKACYEFTIMEKPVGMTKNTFEIILTNAMAEWTKRDSNDRLIKADWTMVLYETKKQIKAYLETF